VSITVADAPPPPLILEGFPTAGVSPLTVSWRIQNNTGRNLVQFEFDNTGSGTFGPATPTFDGTTTTYTGQGLLLPVLRATDDQGIQYRATAVVNLGGVPSLVAKWQGLKDALRRGDLPAALSGIHTESRARYDAIFRQLTPAQLANIDQYMTNIQPVEIGPHGAEYEMLRTRGAQVLSFPVWFQADEDGIWRLRMF
jgi:hypothetical protein